MSENSRVFIRMPFNYDRRKASLESGLYCTDPSRAVQDHKDECDINTIVRRFGLTGQLPTGVRAPAYGDFTSVDSYHSAVTAIASAREAFDAMPSGLRDRFHNDPMEFVEYCLKDENRPELEKYGLVFSKISDLASSSPAPVVSGASSLKAEAPQAARAAEPPAT